MTDLLDIVHEDDDLLVINKPADLVCHPTKTDEYSSLVGRVRLYLGTSVRSHLINRLDRETSGLVIIARNDSAALELRRLWEAGRVRKDYLAIVEGHVPDESGEIVAPLGRDAASRVAIKNCVRPDGAPSATRFERLHRFERLGEKFTLLKVSPVTGRKHQIRIHLAHLGYPIVGDKIYGGDERLYLDFIVGRLTEDQGRQLRLTNHALHAGWVHFTLEGRDFLFEATPSQEFMRFVLEGDSRPSGGWTSVLEGAI